MKRTVSIAAVLSLLAVSAAHAVTGYTWSLGRVVLDVQLLDVRGPYSFDEFDFPGRWEPLGYRWPQTPALRNGKIADAGQAVRDFLQAEKEAAEREEEDNLAPDTGYDNLERQQQFLLKALYRLWLIHYPQATWEQFLRTMRDDFDATKLDASVTRLNPAGGAGGNAGSLEVIR